MTAITPEILLQAYATGIFPMAESAEAKQLLWFDPEMRGILPLDAVHVPQRLQRTLRHHPYSIKVDTAFTDVMRACADTTEKRQGTWINTEIVALYSTLYQRGHAHSVEVWDKQTLIGGLYGVQLGAAFFGESMFSRARDTSKIALMYLVAILRQYKYELLDCQFVTDHLTQFGVIEITRSAYKQKLAHAISFRPTFYGVGSPPLSDLLAAFLQDVNQTS
jgi:leucyl/phenylalanyl-tRNA---protein transferase